MDECLEALSQTLDKDIPLAIAKRSIQCCIERERLCILENRPGCMEMTMEEWCQRFSIEIKERMSDNLRKVINGTGVVIHTNLGRSLLSEDASKKLVDAATHYSNLEFNLANGKRGSRYSLVEDIICELTGAEAALVVNNCAAAVLLVLETLASGKEAIVSRGQLVEIGGSFRVPEIMAKSGAKLVEVGATNRTHLRDYANGITEETALILKVHTSNFRLIGFTSQVSAEEMVDLVKDKDIAVMEDLGSGCMVDLSQYGLPKEPTVQEVLASGVDVVTFSGDKLLGGPQAGIIAGKKKIIDKVKQNPLNRALRIDKFTLATLESILRNYYDLEKALKSVPTLSLLTQPPEVIKRRGQRLLRRVKKTLVGKCNVELVPTTSRVGGGAMPEYQMESWALEFEPTAMKITLLESLLRKLDVPVIGRIENERFLLDCRTIQEKEVNILSELLKQVFERE